MVLEGSTANGNETNFGAVDPDGTGDQYYYLPNLHAANTMVLVADNAYTEPAYNTEIVSHLDRQTVYQGWWQKYWFRSQPHVPYSVTAGGTWSTTGNPNYMVHQGDVFEVDMKATVGAPNVLWSAAEGIYNPVLDATNEGIEITQGITTASPAHFVVDTDIAFYFRVLATVTTVANTDQFYVGFRTAEGYQDADLTAYTDYAAIGIGDLADGGPGDFMTQTESAGGGTTATDLTTADWVNGGTHSLEVRVAADGTTTYEVDGAAAAGAAAFDMPTANVIPFIWILADVTGADPVIYIHCWEIGYGVGS
jgi:hypothetical protein